ncbi:MAG: nitronate monooxygenase [Defluviitaleaceae bacterium]|nr:nitronate monooxygenase [Defluviitaleaceae bacterium]
MNPIIIQGGMGVGVSLSSLAGAVAAEGGIGVISAALPGYNREGFLNNPLKANLEALAEHIKIAKYMAEKAGNGGLVGVNIMCALSGYADYVKCCMENGADLIISGAGLPTDLPALLADSGGVDKNNKNNKNAKSIKNVPIVSSKKAASILLRLWDKKFGKTAHMLIIEGPKAGGHLGFSHEELEKYEKDENLFKNEIKLILQEVACYEEKYNRKIPVIFAGGVHSREDIKSYTALGCAGVQIATRFVATEECDAAQAFKEAYVRACTDDIKIVKSPVGMPGRALKNEFSAPVSQCLKCINHCNPAKIPYCISRALINAVRGDIKNGLIFCGANVDKITKICTVKEIMNELREFPC